MSTGIDIEALKRLSDEKKLRIIDALWASIEGEPEFELSPEQVAEMKRRLAAARERPEDSMTLDEFKQNIEKSA